LISIRCGNGREILVDDKLQQINEPSDALAAGIGMVHQHFMLIPVFTVAENIILGHEKSGKLGVLDIEKAREEISRVSREYGFGVDPDEIIENLPVGIQQKVEIIKALIYEAKVLILDEIYINAMMTMYLNDFNRKNVRQITFIFMLLLFLCNVIRI
jgi:simple sugar transport system ATP-binding protein